MPSEKGEGEERERESLGCLIISEKGEERERESLGCLIITND